MAAVASCENALLFDNRLETFSLCFYCLAVYLKKEWDWG